MARSAGDAFQSLSIHASLSRECLKPLSVDLQNPGEALMVKDHEALRRIQKEIDAPCNQLGVGLSVDMPLPHDATAREALCNELLQTQRGFEEVGCRQLRG